MKTLSSIPVQQEWHLKSIYIYNAYIYSTLQFISHTVKSFASMEAVMQVYILSRHCTIVSMTLAMLMQHQSGRSQCQLQNYWICQLKKKKKMEMMVEMISSSVHSFPYKSTPMLPTTIWFINGQERIRILCKTTSCMRNGLRKILNGHKQWHAENNWFSSLPCRKKTMFVMTRNWLWAKC